MRDTNATDVISAWAFLALALVLSYGIELARDIGQLLEVTP